MKDDVKPKAAFILKLVKIFEQNLKDDRVTIPLMKTIEMLLQSDYMAEVELAPELMQAHSMCVQECNKSKNIVKLMASIGVFANMLPYQDKELAIKALRSLLFLLYHAFPTVRKQTAEKLYTSLLTMEDFDMIVPGGEDAYEEAIEMLSETDWVAPLKDVAAATKI